MSPFKVCDEILHLETLCLIHCNYTVINLNKQTNKGKKGKRQKTPSSIIHFYYAHTGYMPAYEYHTAHSYAQSTYYSLPQSNVTQSFIEHPLLSARIIKTPLTDCCRERGHLFMSEHPANVLPECLMLLSPQL